MSIFDLFRKDAKHQPAPAPADDWNASARKDSQDPAETKSIIPEDFDSDYYTKLANSLYPGIMMFARDINLDPALAAKYVPDMIIREKGFTDATSRFMGMVTTHRYVILSNHMADLSPMEHGTNWGLCVANLNAHFKVLGTVVHEGKTGIFLLHLPDDDTWKEFRKVKFSMDDQLFEMAVERFKAKCTGPVVPELAAEAWLDRCAWPIGMTIHGELFPLEDNRRYTLDYLKELAERPDNKWPAELLVRHDVSMKKWRLTVKLEETRTWFLSVFIKDDGSFDKFSLDDESASDSHYEFEEEDAIRAKLYREGDESLYFGDILKRYAAENGGASLLSLIRPYVTAEFHFD